MICKGLLPSTALLFPLFCLLVMVGVPLSFSNPELFENCRPVEFRCGHITATYPFYGSEQTVGCGHPDLRLSCENGTTKINIDVVEYQVLNIHPDNQTMRIARWDLIQDLDFCTSQTKSFKNSDLFELASAPAPGYTNLTLLYDCPSLLPTINGKLFSCNPTDQVAGSSYKNVSVIAGDYADPTGLCWVAFTVPILQTSLGGNISAARLKHVLKGGFEVRWKVDKGACDKCLNTGGSCGFFQGNQTLCYCLIPNVNGQPPTECVQLTTERPDQSHAQAKGSILWTNIAWKLAIGVGAPTIFIFVVISYLILTRKKKLRGNQKVKAFMDKYESLVPTRYSYSDIKKITKTFKDKLGQGGYGSVYKGKLHNDQLVAVKILSESKGDGEEFINEVASISQTSHVNIVSLLGFCYHNSKRALIYEFMPNGSLDRFIYKKHQNQTTNLNWMSLYQITVGIARGLEYLHQGCKTRILHLDIKPHNILLDEEFCPKISDFGLAKLCQRKESIISMLGARGTAGYMAPEVFNRSFGGVSYKSDVYSFGMMVLEMVGGRRNIDVEISHTSQIYFPSWVYRQLELGQDLELHGVVSEEDERIVRKMVLVSLWCIQMNPLDRPSMTKVVEMLEGSLESLQTPPQPFLSSPVREQQNPSPIPSST